MVKAIHIGRSVKTGAEFKALVKVLESLGLDLEPGEAEQNATFTAPVGRIKIGRAGTGDVPGGTEGTDLLLEVRDPDSIFQLLNKQKLRFLADHQRGNCRLFVVELPGGIKTAIFGKLQEEASGISGDLNADGVRFGVVVSRFNSFITERLLSGALDALHRTGAREQDIQIVRVPGSFEIPAAARKLAETGGVDAVICLGCLLRGETLHYEVIANEVTRGIGQSAQETGVPHALGVLTCDTLEQAIDRAGLKSGNKGYEAALSAVEMASLTKVVGRLSAVSGRRSLVGAKKSVEVLSKKSQRRRNAPSRS